MTPCAGWVGRNVTSDVVSENGDPNNLSAMTARFNAPVCPGKTLRVEFWHDGAFRAKRRTGCGRQ